MNTTPSTHQDLGPLIWVRGEIDLALIRASEALGNEDHQAGAEPLKFAQTHLHQARGALAIVGLDGLTHFCDALEQLFADWHAGRLASSRGAASLAQRAIASVRGHLDELVAGGADQPMRLMPLYRDLMALRGETVVVPSELFFPDLTLRPPAPAQLASQLSPLDRARALRAARSQFERGLLRFLRDDREGLPQMRQAIGAIEQMQSVPATRAFWWVCGALTDGLAQGAIRGDFFIKRLCARMDVQMRRLLEGSRGVAERLMRDSLYFIATAEQLTPHIRQVRDTYQLDALLAPGDTAGHDDFGTLRPALAALRESLGQGKDAWTRFSSGAAVGLPQFHEQCEAMVAAAGRVGQPDLARLAAALLDLGQWLRRDPLQHTENLAMEVATALLVMDALVEQFSRAQSEDLPGQVDTLIDRLARARRGETLPAMQIPLFDEMSRRAQERLFMGQVAREIMASLADVEQQLDGYFRDPSRAAELAALAGPLKQIDGALNMLGQDAAVSLVRRAAAQIADMAKPEHEIVEGEFEALAHQLSGLGFFVDKLQYGPADLDLILNPRSAAQDAAEAGEGASVESELANRREKAAQLLDRLSHGGADEHTRDELRQALETIRQDAKLLADEKLEQRATEALAALKAGEAVPDAAIADAVQGIGQTPHESLAPSADTVRLAEASQEDFDAELLEIFIEEAREVLDTMASSTDAARRQPHSQDLLTTLRRGFHTLKGSGRMVGLRDLGEAAFAVEQVMNRWLGSERDGTPELFDLLDGARMLFAGWVDRLSQGDTRSPEHDWLQPACDAIQTHDAEPAAAPAAEALAEDAVPGAAVAGSDLDLDIDFDFDLEADMPAAGPVAANAFEPDTGLDSVTNIVALDAPLDATGGDVDLELDFDLDAPGVELTLPESTIDITSDIDAEERALDAGADRTLFDLFLAEARGHVATLRRELTRLHINPSLRPSQDSLLAAHTLGGISLTVSQEDISALARSLEHALLRCEARGDAPHADQSALLNSAASALEAQVAAIGSGAIATPAPELIARLDALFGAATIVPETVELQVLELPDMDIMPLGGMTEVLAEAPEPMRPEAFDTADEMAAPGEPALDIVAADLPPVNPFEKVALPDEYVLAETAGNEAQPFELARLPSARATVPAESAQAFVVPDEIDHQLLPIFIEEAHDLLREIGSELRSWRDDTDALSASDALRRQLHTLKGSARMAGVMRFGDLVHSMETLIEQPCAPDDRALLLDELDLGYDRCEELVAKLERGEALTPETVAAEDAVAPTSAAEGDAGAPRERPSVRVRSDMVDRFVNEAGEMSIARTRIEGELRSLRGSLNDLTENVQRLRSQLREIEIQAESQMQSRMAAAEAQHEQFDPLEMDRFTRFQELSRMMAESLSDVTTVQYNLVRNLDAADTAIQSQARLNRDLSQALMSVRMVPFSTLEDRLYRVARQSAKETGKKVNLELTNTRIELDREVLEKMTGPIEHLLRNAVAHGIEPRATREAAGKSETGEIVISLTQQTNEVVIELVDDGGGLAFERIRARAVERGLLGADEEADERRLTSLIFEPGFSTAEQLSELAGRGVGMDVVRNATTALGGRIETTSEAGRGTRFRLSLPMTLAVTQSLLVSSGGKTYAIPSSMVKHAHELRDDEAVALRLAGGQEWMDHHYTYHYLPRLLGNTDAQPGTGTWLLLLGAGNELMALEADGLRGNQEVVVKPVGPQLSRLAGIAGATVLADGEVTLIINPVSLASRIGRMADRPDIVRAVPEVPEALPPLIMVVDDSLTVRKVSSRLLEREGYRVITAKDGIDALEKLADKLPAVMLVDIEMPRMDGFELTLQVRADARTRDIPIVMITSRIAEKHQAYAREIGVNEYLGKPYDEAHLLQRVADFTGGSGRR
ncbi:Hpt domain-containing protein [Methyloversatilis sp. XJ19-49]|uniref:Hpt domain-containing protein n=1 Tax=Methyloversatilis sp. XJ19-49 TaxID=2963429 RepID=UPI00211D0DE2|nr:Hpt domain-containing protein [Methyloversatilis sp. XJ19-49]MCQ9377075.1 Hpt domain-containing protein [Methyloversatilis sp. XJ19-49]